MLGGITVEELDQALNYIENDIENEYFKIGDIVYFFYISKSVCGIFSGEYLKGKIVEKEEVTTLNEQQIRYKLNTEDLNDGTRFTFSYDNDTYYTVSELSKTKRGLFKKIFKQNHIKICGQNKMYREKGDI